MQESENQGHESNKEIHTDSWKELHLSLEDLEELSKNPSSEIRAFANKIIELHKEIGELERKIRKNEEK